MQQVKTVAIAKQAIQVNVVKVNPFRIDAPRVLFFVIGQSHEPLRYRLKSLAFVWATRAFLIF